MAAQHYTLNIPKDPSREDAIFKPAREPMIHPEQSALFIFVHGLADSAAAVENIGDQFQQGRKLPWMSWIFPNAKFNGTTMDKAWFTPNSLPYHAPSRQELVPEEDENGMLETVSYLESLIDVAVSAGISPNRIVLGGFSQGCAMSLLAHLTSTKYSGKLAGVAGLLGYLPLCDSKTRIQELRSEVHLPPTVAGDVPVFLARGTRDEFIPKRAWDYTVEALKDLGIRDELLEVRVYDGLTHTINGAVLRDLCIWLEKVLPQGRAGA